MDDKLTILTDPVPCGFLRYTEAAKALARRVKRTFRPLPLYQQGIPYRGHHAVTRSMVEGMRQVGANFNYDPQTMCEVGNVVVVLSNVEALRQAIAWKREGRINKLLAGPNILVWPSDHPEIGCPEVDLCITPCDWTCAAYEQDLPVLKGRCVSWPAGVDVKLWKPATPLSERKNVAVFIKNMFAETLPEDYLACLQEAGFAPDAVRYILRGEGKGYLPDEYYRACADAKFMIGFSQSESQGLAWAEAWAMDVPTLIWQNKKKLICGKEAQVSTAPYLTAQTGFFFEDRHALSELLGKMSRGEVKVSPRDWVLENMSDQVCARKFISIAGLS